jgi:geranylgeranyl pyrophosphate synthase
MYVYTIQAMPGSKAKHDGDTSVKYQVRRKQTAAPAKAKSSTVVIRTDMGYTEATALVERFNNKELESRAIKNKADSVESLFGVTA